MAKQPAAHHGLLLIDKPAGCTSHDVVDRVRRVLRQKRVGHCGTLDPAATGLLLLTTGRATRLSRFLTGAPKVYQGQVRFGAATDTYDATGEVTARGEAGHITADQVRTEMDQMTGRFEQAAPAYSAKKIGGRKSYELARQGETVPVRTKEVEVFRFVPLSDPSSNPSRVDFELACSTGTYARSMAHDLGVRLACPSHLAELRRTKVGALAVEDALPLDHLERLESPQEVLESPAWLPFDRIPLPFPDLAIDLQQTHRVTSGQTALVQQADGAPPLDEGDWVRLQDRAGTCVAIGFVAEQIGSRGLCVVQPKIVFN